MSEFQSIINGVSPTRRSEIDTAYKNIQVPPTLPDRCSMLRAVIAIYSGQYLWPPMDFFK